MAEIKSFRISDETKERLEALSASIGGNKDQVFNTLMDAYSLEQEKASVAETDQAKNIETFEQYANALVRFYLEALRSVSSSDDRIRGEFQNQLAENAQTIKELRKQRDQMVEKIQKVQSDAKSEVDEAIAKTKELKATVDQLEKSLSVANEQADAKQAMNEILLSQVKQAEKEHDEYEQMKANCQTLEMQLREEKEASASLSNQLESRLQQAISENKKQMYEAEMAKKDAIRQAENAIRKEKDAEIEALKKQLFDLQSKQLSDQIALQESKTALLSLRLELTQAHQKELGELREEKDKKIEELQNRLLQTR